MGEDAAGSDERRKWATDAQRGPRTKLVSHAHSYGRASVRIPDVAEVIEGNTLTEQREIP
jgi:hypothetical protein